VSDDDEQREAGAESRLIDQMVIAAGAAISDHVTIAGSNIELLIGLLRRGFADVTCVVPICCPIADEADVLILPKIGSLDDLRQTLTRLGRCLHHDGVVVIYDRQPPTPDHIKAFRCLLAELGFSFPTDIFLKSGCIHATRKFEIGSLRSAA
jgi:hypothetical protein